MGDREHLAASLRLPFTFLFMLLIPVLFVQGCIAIPIPDRKEEGRIAGRRIDFLRIGITKKEVLKRLGDPTVIWEDERLFAYNWKDSWGQIQFGVLAPGGGSGGSIEVPSNVVLLIRFDPRDRVERFEATKPSTSDSYREHLDNWLKRIKEAPDS